MATRYWHWLLAQQQKKKTLDISENLGKENYEVEGTVKLESSNIFDPNYDEGEYIEEGYIVINTQQNGNNSGN